MQHKLELTAIAIKQSNFTVIPVDIRTWKKTPITKPSWLKLLGVPANCTSMLEINGFSNSQLFELGREPLQFKQVASTLTKHQLRLKHLNPNDFIPLTNK